MTIIARSVFEDDGEFLSIKFFRWMFVWVRKCYNMKELMF